MLESEAKERQKLSQGRGKKGVEKIPQVNKGKARDKAGEIIGVNRQYVSDVKEVMIYGLD